MMPRSLCRLLLELVAVTSAVRPSEKHESPFERTAGGVGQDLVEEAGHLVPAERQEEANRLFNSLPTPELAEHAVVNHRLVRDLVGEAQVEKFKHTVKKSDLMDEAGTNIRDYASSATDSVLNVHKNMKDWSEVVKDNIRELDRFSTQGMELHRQALEDMKNMNDVRLHELNELVDGSVELDNRMRQRPLSAGHQVFEPEHRDLASLRAEHSPGVLGSPGSG